MKPWRNWRWRFRLVAASVCLFALLLSAFLVAPFVPRRVAVEIDPNGGEVWIGDYRLYGIANLGDPAHGPNNFWTPALGRAMGGKEAWLKPRRLEGGRVTVHLAMRPRYGAGFWKDYLGGILPRRIRVNGRDTWYVVPPTGSMNGGMGGSQSPSGSLVSCDFEKGFLQSDVLLARGIGGSFKLDFEARTLTFVPGVPSTPGASR